MRGRFKKCLASIMAVLMMCSVYVVPAGAATTQKDWDNISTQPLEGIIWYENNTIHSYSVEVYTLPEGASVRWTLKGTGAKYLELEYGEAGHQSQWGEMINNDNNIKVVAPPAKDSVVELKAEVFDKDGNSKRTFTTNSNVEVSVKSVSIIPPEDVDLKAMELGTYHFTAEQSPSNTTSSIYYTLQNADGTPVNESAATVDKEGNVTLKALGTYTLKAEAKYSRDGRNITVGVSDSITIRCQPNPAKYFIEQKEGGAVPASIKVGDTLSLVLVKEIEETPVFKMGEIAPVLLKGLLQKGVITKGQAAKPIYAIEANGLPTEGDIRISTREKNIFETVIGNTEASGVQWSNDSGPYEYEVVESLDIKEIVENTELEGSLQAVGQDQSGNTSQSGNDAQSGENGQSEDDAPSADSARPGNTSGSEDTVKSGETGDSYYIGVGNSATAGTGLNFDVKRTGVAYEWTASNDCVTIGSDGVLKGIKPGTVEITGAYKDYDNDVEGSVSVELEVKEQKLEAVKNDQAEGDETSGNNIGIPSVDNTDEKPVIEPAPILEISGPDKIILAPGYNTALYNFSVVAFDPIQTYGVKVENEDENYKYKFDLVERVKNAFKISILSGLPNGTKIPLTIWASVKGENGINEYVEKAVIVQVSENAPSAGILGDNSITLEEGYAPAQYNYNLSGEPTPVVSLYAGHNTANAILENGAVTIPQGLTKGEYYFTLLAENDKGKASKKVKVIVTPKKEAPQITGEDTISLDAGYGQPVLYEYSVTGYPKAEVSLLEAGNTAKAVMADGKVTIPQDLGVGSYSFTLQAENSEGATATKTVTVVVGIKPIISGADAIDLVEGYEDTQYSFSAEGEPIPEKISLQNNYANAELVDGVVLIRKGLGVGTHFFTIVAENRVGTSDKTVKVNVAALQPTDPQPGPIVPTDGLTPKQLLQSTKQKSDIQNEKAQVKEPSEEVEPVKEPAEKEAAPVKEPEKVPDSTKEPAKKEAEPTKEPVKKEEPTKEPAVKKEEPAVKKEEPVKEPAKEEGTTKEPSAEDEKAKAEPAES